MTISTKEYLLRFILTWIRKDICFNREKIIPSHRIHHAVKFCVSSDRRLRDLKKDGVVAYTFDNKENKYNFKGTLISKMQKELRRLEKNRRAK